MWNTLTSINNQRGPIQYRIGNLLIIFVLVVFLFPVLNAFGDESQTNPDINKRLKEEILNVFKDGGEKGLLNFIRDKKNQIDNQFIVEFAKSGVNERKEEWLQAAMILAEEKNDEKTKADVFYRMGEYYFLLSDNKKSLDYFDRALLLYLKIGYLVGQGNVYKGKGLVYFYTGDFNKAVELYDKAMEFFEKASDLKGLGTVYLLKGKFYYYTGKIDEALEMYDKAQFLFEKVGNISDLGNVYQSKGSIYLRKGDNSKALEMYDKALIFFEKDKNVLGQGNVYLMKGDIYYYSGDIFNALKTYDQALLFLKKTGDLIGQGNVYFRKGDIYSTTGNNSQALEMAEKALLFYEKTGEPLGQGNVYLSKGKTYYQMGQKSRTLEMYEKALSLYEKAGDTIGEGNVYRMMGDIYAETGEMIGGLAMYEKALILFIKIGDRHGEGDVYQRKGDIFFKTGNHSRALEMYDKTLIIFEKTDDLIGLGNIYWRKGNIFLKREENSRALEMYEKALSYFEKAGDTRGHGNVLLGKGDIYFKNGDNLKALEIYNKAMVFFEKAGDPKGRGNVYFRQGDIFLANSEYKKATEMYDKALAFFKKIEDIESESAVLSRKAKVLAKQGGKNEALALFEKSIAYLEKIRSQTTFPEMRMNFMELTFDQYEEAIVFMLEKQFYDQAFKYAESIKARTFLDQLAEGLVPLEKGILPEFKQKKDDMVSRLSQINKQIAQVETKSDGKIKDLKEIRDKLQNELEDILIKIRLENPLYASIKYPEPVTVKKLQNDILKKGELLLHFFVSRENVYVFLISKTGFNVVRLEINEKNVNKMVSRYLISISQRPGKVRILSSPVPKKDQIPSETLYFELFSTLELFLKDIKDIIIVPDGNLVQIPFESLEVNKTNPGKPVYLLEKYRVKYIQSASVLDFLRRNYRKEEETGSFIGFGDPMYDYEDFKKGEPDVGAPSQENGAVFVRLPGSGEEVKSIADLFKKKSQKTAIYLRLEANEENAKSSNMKNFDYIHFSCHGIVGPNFQALVLSQTPQSKEDGFFTPNEIMNCDYNAKLIVLSASDTGRGEIKRGEGVIGMTRAFMYAGTPAVVASLWNVDDGATKELMLRFYQNILEKKMDKTEALRQAKLDLIKSEKYASPLFWAAFVMYGE